MNRRDFLKGVGVAGAAGLAGCSAITGGEDDGGDGYAGEPVDPNEDDDTGSGHRVDFVDQAETLGQVATNHSTDHEYDKIVNNYSEGDWEEMDINDLDVARNEIEDSGRGSIDELRLFVEQEIENSAENEPDERAIARGIGIGMNEVTGISASFSAANVLKPAIEKFSAEYLDSDVQTWITGATEPATEGRFAHLPITMVYEEDGNLVRDYIEPSVPDAVGLGGNGQAMRRPEDSVYADSDEREMVTGHEYRKALEMAQNGQIEQEGRAHPVRAVSTNLLSNMWSIVDSGKNDISWENPPPNGLVTHVSQEFGESVEDAFYDLDEQKLEYMENIGRGMQLFYEDRGGRANLAVGGTLEEPEFYEFPDDMKDRLWNLDYDGDLSELEG